MDSEKDTELKINVLQVIYCPVVAWQQVMQSTTVNCFCQCSDGCEFNTEADVDSCTEEDNNVIHKEWIWLGTEKEVYCSSHVSAFSLQYAPHPASVSCVMTVRVAIAMYNMNSGT
jgi:hypothetical protein